MYRLNLYMSESLAQPQWQEGLHTEIFYARDRIAVRKHVGCDTWTRMEFVFCATDLLEHREHFFGTWYIVYILD